MRPLMCHATARWLAVFGSAAAATTLAAQVPPDSVAERPLATREALEALAQTLTTDPTSDRDTALLRRVRDRLTRGDFRAGDLVLLEVRDEPLLSDTFAVGPAVELELPSPTVGALSLHGVLRAELEPEVTRYLRRFVREPVVRARALLRLSIQGEVVRAGFYGVPADAVLADALMAAGGTTPAADMKKLKIERDGETVLEGRPLREAIAQGRTLHQVALRDGDQILVARRGTGGFRDNLSFLWIVVSLAGGIYGLSRAF